MPSNFQNVSGQFVGTATVPRNIFYSEKFTQVYAGKYMIDGTNSRDAGNVPVSILRGGTILGKITATKKYAPSVIGITGKAYTGSTQINCLTTAMATELVRRQGASGTFKLTGPPVASGTVRTQTITYSAVGTGSAANEVQTITPSTTAASGTFTLTVSKLNGDRVTTADVAYTATAATLQTALNLAMGTTSNLIVVTGGPFSGNTAYTLTYSGTGYTALDFAAPTCDTTACLDSGGTAITTTIAETTKGVAAAATIVCTAANVNEVQRVTFAIASSGGNVALEFTDATTGARTITGPAAWSATDATYLAAINVALDLATGVTGGIVATAASATDTDYGFVLTFSGTGYAAKPQDLVKVITLPTSSTSSTVSRTTTGVDGRFTIGALIQPTDGSEAPLTCLWSENGIDFTRIDATSMDQEFLFLRQADLITENIPYLTDTNADNQAWLKLQLLANQRSLFTWSNDRY